MAELSDVHAIIWHTHRATAADTIKEVSLNRVVVERTVDVHGPDGSPVQALGLQVVFAAQFLLVPGVRVTRVCFCQWKHFGGSIDAGTAHQYELLDASASHDSLHKRLALLELPDVVVEDDVELAGAGDRLLELVHLLAVSNKHRDSLEHLLVVGVADPRKLLGLAAVRLATVQNHHLVTEAAQLGNQVAADETSSTHHQDPLGAPCCTRCALDTRLALSRPTRGWQDRGAARALRRGPENRGGSSANGKS
mmetsp:Transcript_45090/g.97959  ORF Transcript_45090/g.97959 Transcript_45090/m.97959 type:complete len:251 (+) Transcript_45090:481-1233(+)